MFVWENRLAYTFDKVNQFSVFGCVKFLALALRLLLWAVLLTPIFRF